MTRKIKITRRQRKEKPKKRPSVIWPPVPTPQMEHNVKRDIQMTRLSWILLLVDFLESKITLFPTFLVLEKEALALDDIAQILPFFHKKGCFETVTGQDMKRYQHIIKLVQICEPRFYRISTTQICWWIVNLKKHPLTPSIS